jgi:hypothetical protein
MVVLLAKRGAIQMHHGGRQRESEIKARIFNQLARPFLPFWDPEFQGDKSVANRFDRNRLGVGAISHNPIAGFEIANSAVPKRTIVMMLP